MSGCVRRTLQNTTDERNTTPTWTNTLYSWTENNVVKITMLLNSFNATLIKMPVNFFVDSYKLISTLYKKAKDPEGPARY